MVEYSSIGEVLLLPGDRYGRQLRPILGLIDSVHRLRTPHRLRIQITRNKRNEGEYHYKPGSFEPDFIEVSRINDSMAATLLHEVGHFLELAVIPGCVYGERQWTGQALTADWLQAILATESVKTLQRIVDSGIVHQAAGSHQSERLGRTWLNYLLTPRELWARSYAQWIARRGGDDELRRFLEKFSFPSTDTPLQWSHKDFIAVEEQFDRIFSKLGWLR